MEMYIGGKWRIRLNRPYAATMQPLCQIALTTYCYYSVVFISAEEEIHRYHNVAQFKTTSQSSLHGPNNPSSLAVDDSLSTCARTDEERGASWTVDLGQTFIVSHLRINTGLFAESLLVLDYYLVYF